MIVDQEPHFEDQSERDYENYVQEFMPTAQEMVASTVNELTTSFALLDEELNRWKTLALKFGGKCAIEEFEAEKLKAIKGNESDMPPF